MSVTAADLLELPSLRHARVLAGRRGLSKIVTSISVLESPDPGLLVDEMFPQGEFFGSEIVITGFLNITEDVDQQCANIRRLAEGGEVGLILFYVGVYLPSVDQRLIDLADQLDFVLICMPERRQNLRYSDVISDVMEAICRERDRDGSIVSDILARMSALPSHQQSINSALKMLSERGACSVVLRDSSGHVLNLVAWPRGMEAGLAEGLKRAAERLESGGMTSGGPFADGQVFRQRIHPDNGPSMELLLIKEGRPLTDHFLSQAVDVVRICVNIWGQRHGEVAVHELVRAILQDEPIKMRRLAEIFCIDVEAIHDMWILEAQNGDGGRIFSGQIKEICAMAEGCASTVLADVYEDRLLLFLSTPSSLKEAEIAMEAVLEAATGDGSVTLTSCRGLGDTAQVREAYLRHAEHLKDAKTIFPLRKRFDSGDLLFAQECRRLIEQGESAIRLCRGLLAALRTENEEWNLTETLSSYLLDGDLSVTKTAALLYLHKNTVKYRIQRISDLLGCRPDRMPQAIRYYQAAAVKRLLDAGN